MQKINLNISLIVIDKSIPQPAIFVSETSNGTNPNGILRQGAEGKPLEA
jgi:hypothetical protein